MTRKNSSGRVVLVTGGSSGLGAAICDRLARSGWRVFAGSRRGTLIEGANPSITPLRCDVTSPHELAASVTDVITQAGSLDAIVCNAGVNVSAPAEELPDPRARTIVETNVWGVINGAKAALPHFRQRKTGVILAVGSLAGMVSPPGEAYYAASKHAVRGFLESLQYEVSGFGVRVRLVEPGFIKTNLAAASSPNEGTIKDYDHLRSQLEHHWHQAIEGGVTSDFAARKIQRVLENPNSAFRTRIGRDAIWVPRFKALLPEKVFFAIARRRFGLEEE